MCAGRDAEDPEGLSWWVPVEVALLFAGVRGRARERLVFELGLRDGGERGGEPALAAYWSGDVMMGC